jgi:hypothetical protein
MSIFSNLLQLNKNQIILEDFFTEIFGYLLESNTSLMQSWLKEFKISDINPENITVSTQESFSALETHLTGSRPDIYIELSNESMKEIIFLESKIDSSEGQDQLKRYAEHLDNLDSISRGVLVYVTRDYDKKDRNLILGDCKNEAKLEFKQLRWYENYRFLKEYNESISDKLIIETIKFMEEQGLSQNNKFTVIDVLAITNFPRVRKMLDESMGGEVAARFEEVAGKKPVPSTVMNDLRNDDIYAYEQEQKDKNQFYVILGYYMNKSNITDFPDVGLELKVNPHATDRKEIIKAMKEIERGHGGWNSYCLNENRWAGISKTRNLEKFMQEEDHIKAIQIYFLELLDELIKIKETYPDLKWMI